uniref:Uncharacterized protein n=1 Tax=Parascaris univalens TaxID=6257 RepID=A0A915BEI9_PARUN
QASSASFIGESNSMEGSAMDNGECWPIYLHQYISSLRALPVPELAGTVSVPEDKICKSIPQIRITGAEMKVSYLLDHSYVPIVDVSTDNLGIWNSRHRSTTTRTFFLKGSDVGSDEDCERIVRKRMYKHVNAKPLGGVRKVVWTLFGSNGVAFRSLVSYHIAEGAEVMLTTHGNARTLKQVYAGTYPASLRRVKELRRAVPSREVLPVMVAQQGGSSAVAQCSARNRIQLYSMSRNKVPPSRRCAASGSSTLMDELFKISESAVEGNDLKPFYDGSTHDLSLATPQQEESSAMLNCGQSNVYEDDVSHMGPSHEMTSFEFKAQLVNRLGTIPVEQRGEVRARIEHELDTMFADKVAAEIEQVFDQSSRGSVMERLLAMVTP